MADENEIRECISLEEIPPRDSPASAPSPSADCPSVVDVTEEAELGSDAPADEGEGPHVGQESPSIKLPRELDSSGEDEGDSWGERVAEPHNHPRVIAVSPRPGAASPDVKSDHDSGVKIDNDDEDEDHDDATPDKPRARTPSLVSCEAQSASSRSVSPDDAGRGAPAPGKPRPPAKAASSQPPRFKNDVEPADYQRQAPPAVGYNRAVHSVQCKAMLIIMGTCILAVILIIGFIVLNGGNDEVTKASASLEGVFNITNRVYTAAYAETNSSGYQRLSEEFIHTMKETFQRSEQFYDMYETTTVGGIERGNGSIADASRPQLDFTVFLLVPTLGHDAMTTPTPEVTGSSPLGNRPAPIADVIEYLVNVTQSGGFGNFTGRMELM